MQKAIFGVIAGLMLLLAPAALAAGSPTVAPLAATSIGEQGATLNGTVNSHGAPTTYQFAWGTTTALGNYTPNPAVPSGHGTKAVDRHVRLTGLTPDTTYYYELVASNASGKSATPIETFQTTGNPPPTVTTGAATSVQRDRATFTGTINPNNQATTYYFRWGLSTGYGFMTEPETVPAGSTPVSVSFQAIGLTPGYTFHYQLVASHGPATTLEAGLDSVFETQPYPRPQTALHSYLTPKTIRSGPYSYTVHGTLLVPSSTPASLYCAGSVRVRFYNGSRRLSSVTTPVQPNCSYAMTQKLSGAQVAGAKSHQLKVYVYYEGWTYGGPSSIHELTAYAG